MLKVRLSLFLGESVDNGMDDLFMCSIMLFVKLFVILFVLQDVEARSCGDQPTYHSPKKEASG